MSDAFGLSRKRATFHGGPQDGDTVVLNHDVTVIAVIDPDDENIRHVYDRSAETVLTYRGIATRKQDEPDE